MLFLISNGYKADNPEIYKVMSQSKKIVYIPAWYGKPAVRDYKKFKNSHKDSEVTYFQINRKPKASKIQKLKECDLIYFDGGNTFYLLNQLKKWGLDSLIKKLSKTKNIAGMSAGAILQTPNINLAKIPHFNADDNFVNLKKMKAFSNVKFEVYPHFSIRNKKELKELQKYSKMHNRKIYLLPDGSSLLKNRNKIELFGKSYLLHRGKLCVK